MTCPTEVAERLARMETTLNRIDRELFGNGQEGCVSAMGRRIRKLEKAHWIIYGAIAALSLGMGIGQFSIGALLK